MYGNYHISLAPLFYCGTFPGLCLKLEGQMRNSPQSLKSVLVCVGGSTNLSLL